MAPHVPCPACQKPITPDQIREFPTPFFMKCPYCKSKLKETKVTPLSLLVLAVALPLFIFIGSTVKTVLVSFIPAAEYVPTFLFFIAFCYPLVRAYETWNVKFLIDHGRFQLRKSRILPERRA